MNNTAQSSSSSGVQAHSNSNNFPVLLEQLKSARITYRKIPKEIDLPTAKLINIMNIINSTNMPEKELTGYPSIDKPWLKYYSKEAINTPLPECTIYEYLWENNKDHLGDVALIYFGKKITYKKLFENIDKAANAFLAIGIKQNDIVAMCVTNTPEAVFCFYALNKIGAIANMLDLRLSENEFLELLNEIDNRYLVLLNSCYLNIKRIISQTKISKVIVLNSSSSKLYITHDYLAESDAQKIYGNTSVQHILTVNPLHSANKSIEIRSNIMSSIKEHYPKCPTSDPKNITWETFLDVEPCEFNFDNNTNTNTNTNILFSAFTSGTTGNPKEVLALFDFAIESQNGRGDPKALALNIIKGFMAVNLFSVVPVKLYGFAVAMQSSMSSDMTGE